MQSSRRGFEIMEVIVIITVLGILAEIAVPKLAAIRAENTRSEDVDIRKELVEKPQVVVPKTNRASNQSTKPYWLNIMSN